MSAYIIFDRRQTTDAAELALYGPLVGATLEGRGATKLAGGKPLVLEGEPSEAVVVLEFPSAEEARAWYDSPLYQEATVHRLKGGDWRVMIVEGT
ncbi:MULTISPECIES: DUF1330 domain-containing protein [Alphaproteobacteria]|jgi:uncharacterized protein (DUF1330 family)|uniref:DUF1330 domain-containing protein n=2 Tax=Alphaproteobacteria TaxID=28211 RepID=A0A512HND0_9HYPH|nr:MULTISPECIES: DUF1330 domain-containing protein [Alphaproteobacteria]GEO86939.1 hypothetical protein RNA01_38710 [Ciceribacter naphthalenivorans]GLR24906.1 hypothetical protein GCM10007920_47000 [Ciceribacter naphthalenivorans]GLT07762.1 hypothetical protein GCM10007926_47000 [Sphingomonas psychrolutea]